jgi:hypothetical protein
MPSSNVYRLGPRMVCLAVLAPDVIILCVCVCVCVCVCINTGNERDVLFGKSDS